jgi:hypothetical protein
MARTKTYFEQVPVALAKQVAEEERRGSQVQPVSCVICGAPVQLEHCKVDEDGGAIHEACYFERLSQAR